MSTPGADDARTPDQSPPSRRAVLEGVAVAVAAAVGGFTWFTVAGPATEDELDDERDEQEDRQEQLEDQQEELEDQQDEQDDERDADHDRDS